MVGGPTGLLGHCVRGNLVMNLSRIVQDHVPIQHQKMEGKTVQAIPVNLKNALLRPVKEVIFLLFT